jgi:hypothetical protein
VRAREREREKEREREREASGMTSLNDEARGTINGEEEPATPNSAERERERGGGGETECVFV